MTFKFCHAYSSEQNEGLNIAVICTGQQMEHILNANRVLKKGLCLIFV
jgi:hypothetical protein